MRSNSGFTLIEVMITVAIVAILAAIAVPSYNEYVQRARITEATAALADMRNKMEQYFQDNRTWTPGGGIAPPCTAGTVAPLPTSQNFTFTCDSLAANTYRVVATGNVGTSMNGFTFTINQFNHARDDDRACRLDAAAQLLGAEAGRIMLTVRPPSRRIHDHRDAGGHRHRRHHARPRRAVDHGLHRKREAELRRAELSLGRADGAGRRRSGRTCAPSSC